MSAPVTRTSLITKNPFSAPEEKSRADEDEKMKARIELLEAENAKLRIENENMQQKIASTATPVAPLNKPNNTQRDCNMEVNADELKTKPVEELIKYFINVCNEFKKDRNEMKKQVEALEAKINAAKKPTEVKSKPAEIVINKNPVEAEPVKTTEAEPKSYLAAVVKGAKSKPTLSNVDVRRLNANSFNQVDVKEYATIHFQGVRANCSTVILKSFLKEINVDVKRVVQLWSIGRDIIEVVIHEEYATEMTKILENVHEIPKFKDMRIKRIKFDALDESNIRDPNKKFSAKEIFQTRMKKKLDFIDKQLPKFPHWKRLRNYVELQLKSESFDVHVKLPTSTAPPEVTCGSIIEAKINVALNPSTTGNENNENIGVSKSEHNNKEANKDTIVQKNSTTSVNQDTRLPKTSECKASPIENQKNELCKGETSSPVESLKLSECDKTQS